MSKGPYLRKYGESATIIFDLFEVDGVDFRVDAAHASGDTVIMKDEGAEANTTNGFTDEGNGYSIVLTATEMEAARIKVYIIDQTATKVWLDTSITIETYGHASAQHALDLDDAVRGGMSALPNAAADAAGGLPISDAGGLDMDTLLGRLDAAISTRATAAALAVVDGIVDAILLDTNELQSDDVPGLIAALNDLSASQVNAEVLDVLNTDTFAEPTGVPPATASLVNKLGFLYMALRNEVAITATKKQFHDDSGAVEWEKDLTDDGTTYSESEANAP